MDFKTLSTKVDKKLDELAKYAKKEWDVEFDYDVVYTLKSVRALGQFYQSSAYGETINYIELNKELLLEFGDTYITAVVIHEFAHAVVRNLYPTGRNGYKRVMPHGKEFKAVCSHFGISGKASTSLFSGSTILESKRKNTHTYYCACDTHNLSTVRHNKILRGTATYRCNKCKEVLSQKEYETA